MPLLEAKLDRAESEKIAKSFMRTKQFVPTKSHPGAPTSSPLAEGLAGLLAAPVDKLRTLMEGFPDEETKSAEVDWRSLL
ncbi:putative hemerythrin-like protein [Lachnellula cervina]|uniref:Putative hemerythrin-like protein n=1 Tax=Lachnellula cervina TaxID=1316786 RepID=A0A7D8YNZ2_9HELO|nr:putative hemerythrin-like protein [Lachnellula cervina]